MTGEVVGSAAQFWDDGKIPFLSWIQVLGLASIYFLFNPPPRQYFAILKMGRIMGMLMKGKAPKQVL